MDNNDIITPGPGLVISTIVMVVLLILIARWLILWDRRRRAAR